MRSALPSYLVEWRLHLRRLGQVAWGAFLKGWLWVFGGVPRGWLLTLGLLIALAGVIGGSTATANWVPGSDAIAGPAVIGALMAGLLAMVRKLRWPFGLLPALLAGVPYTLNAVGASSVGSGISAGLSGDYAHAGGAVLFSLALLMWLAGAWLTYCVLRWRRPLLGAVPGIAIVATNVLNFPIQQYGSVFGFAFLTVALLLWTAYSGRMQDAARTGLRLSAESRWDFWESGAVAGGALLIVSFFAPPLSTVDRTVDAQTGIIKAWSDIQIRLHHALPGGESGPTFSTGFTDAVPLGHPLQRNQTEVFTYTAPPNRGSSIYFRGLDVAATNNGEWRYSGPQAEGFLRPGAAPPYSESYQAQQDVTVKVQMLRPPAGFAAVYFYPGQLESLSKQAIFAEETGSGDGTESIVNTVDRVSVAGGARSTAGTYTVTGAYSVAKDTQLRAAGTSYPGWVLPYASLESWGGGLEALEPNGPPPSGTYRPSAVESQIALLARQITAGKTNPYDQASAIEDYLRTSFTYTLKPPATPAGQDPLAFFLFDSKKGYCEYFATAMGDMLRSLGIPTRLVNGFGPGTFDSKTNRYVVRESDAHTWVEVYFPGYGWVPFEPTPDGVYFPFPRGQAACKIDVPICEGLAAAGAIATNKHPHFDDTISVQESEGTHTAQSPSRLPFDPRQVALLVILVLLAAGLLLAARFLTPRTAGTAWRRTQLLSRLAGLRGPPGETPLEFGRRLAKEAPRGAAEALRLAQGFTLAAYAPPDQAGQGVDDVLSGWRGLRPVLIREAAARAARRRSAR